MTIREFLIFIFSNRPIARIYYRKKSKRELISIIASKLTHNDDVKILNQDSKNFVGSFIPNSDHFTANLIRKTIGRSFSLHRFINIHGVLKEEHDKVSIEVEYKQSTIIKIHKIVWVIVFLFILSRVVLISDIQSFSIVLLIASLTLAFILKSYNTILKKQIDFTEKYLIYNE
ncbi:hypothetical protein E9993_01390 [Labilibacter sediminis]|nr:hypothetical protein E9993_01390 [Labilibacter sediminis]